MKRCLVMLLAVCLMLSAFCVPALALDYDFPAPDPGAFAEPTSDSTVYVAARADTNIDRSKTAAVIPPAFGSPTSYTRISGELLTPNLVSQSSGGSAVTVQPSSGIAAATPSVTVSSGAGMTAWTSYTAVTADLYDCDGRLGTLEIPAIGLTVNVYEGTDSATLAKGAGHFTDTSIWNGNAAFAAHNRGVNNHFGRIHTLSVGDTVTYTTKLGTRSYAVYSVSKISVDDTSVLDSNNANTLTLITCVMNEPQYRWCVKAAEMF